MREGGGGGVCYSKPSKMGKKKESPVPRFPPGAPIEPLNHKLNHTYLMWYPFLPIPPWAPYISIPTRCIFVPFTTWVPWITGYTALGIRHILGYCRYHLPQVIAV